MTKLPDPESHWAGNDQNMDTTKLSIKTRARDGAWVNEGQHRMYLIFECGNDGDSFFRAYATSRDGKMCANTNHLMQLRQTLVNEVKYHYKQLSKTDKSVYDKRVKAEFCADYKGNEARSECRVYDRQVYSIMQKDITKLKNAVPLGEVYDPNTAGDIYLQHGDKVENGVTFAKYLSIGITKSQQNPNPHFAAKLMINVQGEVVDIKSDRESSHIGRLALSHIPAAVKSPLWVHSIGSTANTHLKFPEQTPDDTHRPAYVMCKRNKSYSGLVLFVVTPGSSRTRGEQLVRETREDERVDSETQSIPSQSLPTTPVSIRVRDTCMNKSETIDSGKQECSIAVSFSPFSRVLPFVVPPPPPPSLSSPFDLIL
jgi:hypothetical protein